MTGLNVLTRPWDAFIQTICARKEKLQFDSILEESVQEEARVANQEACYPPSCTRVNFQRAAKD
jgi:hypothetical protein